MNIIPKPLSFKVVSPARFKHAASDAVRVDDPTVPKEGYRLVSSREGLKIYASTDAGFYYGKITAEWLSAEGDMPDVIVTDAPRFGYRGFMIDCARHFFTVEELLKRIEVASKFKLNVFHWHLTDDQGWRAEIKRYPRLTEIGSYRTSTRGDSKPVKGFYTREDMRLVVEYAAERHINVLPEVDLPGHMSAAVASYPQLGCTGAEITVKDSFGIHEDVLCAGSDFTYEFIDNVLGELAEIFPFEYFYIGGDEAPKKEWKKCPYWQKTIQDEGLKDEEDLQGYFNNKIAVYLQRKGKRMIGWNEILKASKLENSVIAEYWTPQKDAAVEEYLEAGKNVIIAKHQAFYFDMPYAQNRLKTTYGFTPEKYGINAGKDGILGMEGTLWTEWISTEERIWFQVFPRMQALSEVAWTDEKLRNYKDFAARLKRMLPLFDKAGLGFCPVSMWNPKNPFIRARTLRAFYKSNAHIEYNRAILIQKRRRYKF